MHALACVPGCPPAPLPERVCPAGWLAAGPGPGPALQHRGRLRAGRRSDGADEVGWAGGAGLQVRRGARRLACMRSRCSLRGAGSRAMTIANRRGGLADLPRRMVLSCRRVKTAPQLCQFLAAVVPQDPPAPPGGAAAAAAAAAAVLAGPRMGGAPAYNPSPPLPLPSVLVHPPPPATRHKPKPPPVPAAAAAPAGGGARKRKEQTLLEEVRLVQGSAGLRRGCGRLTPWRLVRPLITSRPEAEMALVRAAWRAQARASKLQALAGSGSAAQRPAVAPGGAVAAVAASRLGSGTLAAPGAGSAAIASSQQQQQQQPVDGALAAAAAAVQQADTADSGSMLRALREVAASGKGGPLLLVGASTLCALECSEAAEGRLLVRWRPALACAHASRRCVCCRSSCQQPFPARTSVPTSPRPDPSLRGPTAGGGVWLGWLPAAAAAGPVWRSAGGRRRGELGPGGGEARGGALARLALLSLCVGSWLVP